MPTGQIYFSQIPLSQMFVDQMSVDQMSVGQIALSQKTYYCKNMFFVYKCTNRNVKKGKFGGK